MYPVLFKLGPLTIHTYGLFVVMGVLSSIFMARSEAKRYGMDTDKILDLCFYIVVAAIIGSRLFYVITYLEYFLKEPIEILKIWNGGLVFYGGFIGAAIIVIIYLKIYRLPLGKTADIGAVALPLGHCLGRIGCFFAGCCYGKTCQMPWAVTFQHPESLAPLNIPLHPTQLYASVSNLIIFLIIFLYRPYKKFDGQLLLVYIIFYGINRSIIEVFRGDFRGPTLLGVFSISQVIGISAATISFITLILLNRRKKS
jgi:phosphatidylglycerol---prolipoprotein diacylglyceryl transferase